MTATLPSTLSEADLQRTVIDYAILRGWRVWHQRPAQVRNGRWASAGTGHVGVPDLVLARDGRVLLVELKTHTGRLTTGQRDWLTHLGGTGRCWRPSDWRTIMDELA